MSEVFIAGAGPTGLALALELQRREIPVRIIDQREGLNPYSRALGIQGRTLELLEKMDLLTPFLKEGLRAGGATYHWKQKKLQLHLNELDAPFPFVLILPQSKSEEILLKAFEARGGQVTWKTRLIELIDGQPLIEHPDGKREVVQATWVIGCDGAHSRVRHSLHFPFKGTKFPETFLMADVTAKTAPLHQPQVFFSRKGLGVILPTHDYLRLIFPLKKPLKEEPSSRDLETLLQERGYTDPLEIEEIRWLSSFQVHRRLTQHMRKENVFLAGDAAHIHSPVGGQGMNTSIQDAWNLAWKLALVIKGEAPEILLDSYETERHPIARAVLKETTRATKFMLTSQRFAPSIFYWGLRLLLSQKRIRIKILEGLSEISLHYCESPIVRTPARDKEWHGPKSGERAPDVILGDRSRLFDYLHSPRHTLLLFREGTALEEAIHQEYGELIDVYVVEDRAVRKKYAAGPDSLYLIRPDGYIGYRSRHFQFEEVIAYLLRIFTPSSQRNRS